jgi:hypothetical protein
MSDLLLRGTHFPPATELDERPARAELRRQIGRLELELSRLVAEAFPRVDLEPGVAAVSAEPRALGLGDLERVRDGLAQRIAAAREALAAQDELETANRELLDDMLAKPADFKWLRISRADVGQPGCGSWHSRPRFGLLGMLMGWWRVKISSGCPL